MKINFKNLSLWEGLGTAVVGVLLGFGLNSTSSHLINQRRTPPTYSMYSYPIQYNSIDEFKADLLSEAKKKLVLQYFEPRIDSLLNQADDDGYILTKEEIIAILKNYVYIKNQAFKNSEIFGESSVWIDKNDINLKAVNDLFQVDSIKAQFGPLNGNLSVKEMQSVRHKFMVEKLVEHKPELRRFAHLPLYLLYHRHNFEVINFDKQFYNFKGYYCPFAIRALMDTTLRGSIGTCEISPGRMSTDNNNNAAVFQFIYLSKEYAWKYRSLNQIESTDSKGKRYDGSIISQISSKEMSKNLDKVHDIICIGTASCEGSNRDRENRRAKIRAKQIVYWFLQKYPNLNMSDNTTLNLLNLGQYHGDCKSMSKVATAYQRRIIIIGVTYKESGVNIKEAVENVLQRNDSPINISKYDLREYEPKVELDLSHFLKEQFEFNNTNNH